MKFTMKKAVLAGIMTIGLAALVPTVAWGINGQCASCHTMHNSQNGGNMNGTATANAQLLMKNGCIGCHMDATWTNTNYTDSAWVPQVDGTSMTGATAGGYFTAGGDQTLQSSQHDIATYSPIDTLSGTGTGFVPPGGATLGAQLTCEGTNGCHSTVGGAHHSNASGKITGAASAGASYRFLEPLGTATTNYVDGIEDDDYEMTSSSTDHNVYSAELRAAKNADTTDANTISALCAACHGAFHGVGADQHNGTNWVRHPTDWGLTTFGTNAEHAAYDTYSTEAPVGAVIASYTDGAAQQTAITSNTASAMIVVCTSCHVAHGSDRLDLLRFDYSLMQAGTTGAGQATGCFRCHTAKDG